MRKHLIGVAIFVLIVGLFGAFLANSRIREREPAGGELELRVGSSYYDLDSRRFTTDVELTWNGAGPAPERVFIVQRFDISDPDETMNYRDVAEIKRPFSDSRKARLVIESDGIDFDRALANLYGRFEASANQMPDSAVSPAVPVLFVH
ncbi:MAG: hypothetical protein IPJ30_03965 [Acidobacteria bacterium]|nr:hypothetical protein [Acidobacteriota bacterium]